MGKGKLVTSRTSGRARARKPRSIYSSPGQVPGMIVGPYARRQKVKQALGIKGKLPKGASDSLDKFLKQMMPKMVIKVEKGKPPKVISVPTQPVKQKKEEEAWPYPVSPKKYAKNRIADININDASYKTEVLNEIKTLPRLSVKEREDLLKEAHAIKPSRGRRGEVKSESGDYLVPASDYRSSPGGWVYKGKKYWGYSPSLSLAEAEKRARRYQRYGVRPRIFRKKGKTTGYYVAFTDTDISKLIEQNVD